jgi:hypothetical protein
MKKYWYEIFVDKGEKEGTETIDRADTLIEAAKKLRKERKRITDCAVYVDRWEIQENGEPRITGMTPDELALLNN